MFWSDIRYIIRVVDSSRPDPKTWPPYLDRIVILV